jgi:chromodomain-helicase-DNA-binding protein 7
VETSIASREEAIIQVELIRIQKTYNHELFRENAPSLLHQITGGSLPLLLNSKLQLREVCTHPFLIKGATPKTETRIAASLGEQANKKEIRLRALINSSGKMIFF